MTGKMTDTLILIVDDDRTILRLCQRLLERSAYHVVTALDPFDALSIVEQQKVDLLLSDIRMPRMDGFELIKRAKQLQPDLPVLLMTGYGSIDTAIQALHRGVDGLILKPFASAAELTEAVYRILDESRQKRDAARLHVLRPLFDVTERLLAETSPQVLETLILDSMQNLSQARFAGIYRLTARDLVNDDIILIKETEPLPDSERKHLYSLFATEGGAAIYSTGGVGSSAEAQRRLRAVDWGTVLVARVQQKESALLFCASRGPESGAYSESDLEMFVILARQAAAAMENARLYSDMKEYVRQLEESQRALVQAEKMAAVGRLMASVAHEINNPLQALRNSLHLAARKEVALDQRSMFLEMASGQLERLVKTVREMLDFYRPGGDEWELVDIRQLINQILLLLGPQMKEQRVKLILEYRAGDALVLGSSDQIQQVILNLLINAMDSLEEDCGGAGTQMKEIWIDIDQVEDHLHLRIEDSGAGVPLELQERIFEPFVSTKKKGTGLGLAVSYGIMERHQGSLTIIPPRYQQGACFQMILPIGVEEKNG
jgi:signal transduction histidine kinase/CheY-like chemotaxis protein